MPFCNFSELNSGTWVTQRTTYLVQNNITNDQKSRLLIEQREENHSISPQEKSSIYLVTDKISQKINYSLQPVHFYDDNIEQVIKIIKDESNNIYVYFNKMNYISVTNSLGQLNSLEKIWLINPNLRFSVSIVKKADVCVAISFSSDIRIK